MHRGLVLPLRLCMVFVVTHQEVAPHAAIVVVVLLLRTAAVPVLLSVEPPDAWVPRGITGGGAFFAPAMHPTNAAIMAVTTDMGSVYRSSSAGDAWQTLPYWQLQGGRPAQVRFTDSNITFAISTRAKDGSDGAVPSKSTDTGLSFAAMHVDPTQGHATFLDVDATATHLVLADSENIYSSADGGATFSLLFTSTNHSLGIRMAGDVYFGANGLMVVGTNQGVVIVPAEGQSPIFVEPPSPDVGILGFAAATQAPGTTSIAAAAFVQLYALTAPRDLVTSSTMIELGFTQSIDLMCAVWSPSLALVASPLLWRPASGLPPLVGRRGSLGATFVRTDAAGGVYLAGQCAGDCLPISSSSGGYAFVLYNGGEKAQAGHTWKHLFRGVSNTRSGWEGPWQDGPLGNRWSWGGGILGFAVAAAPNGSSDNPVGESTRSRLTFTDDGFIHGSTDGGKSWSALYVRKSQRSPFGVHTPTAKSWEGNGLMDQSCWGVGWSDKQHLFGCYTDLRGVISNDSGQSWSFNYTGQKLNTMYHTALDVNSGTMYAATSSVHDMYMSTRLTDASIDKGTGLVLSSQNSGSTWTTIFDAKMPVVWVALDPRRPNRLYASCVHSVRGGIFLTDSLSKGAKSVWRQLPAPPRTTGHPYVLRPLLDGSLLASYSGRMDDSRHTFYNSSGIFLLPESATSLKTVTLANGHVQIDTEQEWLDRSDLQRFVYWTKDVAVDPLDSTQSTCVPISDSMPT